MKIQDTVVQICTIDETVHTKMIVYLSIKYGNI